MASPEVQSQSENLFTQYSRLRSEKRAEMIASGMTEVQIREALRDIIPFKISSLHEADPHEGMDEGPDNRWDVPDSFDEMPGMDDLETRLDIMRSQFQRGDRP